MSVSLTDLRRYAIDRSLFPLTTLKRAIDRLGFVQADPIRAPARTQDLSLRQRVKGYRAGDLERRYARLGVEEDTFITYGFVPSSVFALPQWHRELKSALQRARQPLAHARAEGVDWYWPAEERVPRGVRADTVRLLAPFDPVVWDRRRFELFWGWAYRFEAYTPASRRQRGYYALPLLWRDHVIGWGNVSVKNGGLQADFGYVDSQPPREGAFTRGLEAELDRLRTFLGLRS